MCREITKASCIASLPLKSAFLRHAFRFPHSLYSPTFSILTILILWSCATQTASHERSEAASIRPQAGTSEARRGALSAAKGEQEEDNTGRFQIDYGYRKANLWYALPLALL